MLKRFLRWFTQGFKPGQGHPVGVPPSKKPSPPYPTIDQLYWELAMTLEEWYPDLVGGRFVNFVFTVEAISYHAGFIPSSMCYTQAPMLAEMINRGDSGISAIYRPHTLDIMITFKDPQ